MSETKNLKLFKHEEPLETNNNKFDIDKALNKNWDKVDDYAGEANSKIDLITEIIDLLPKVSNEGESIALENTARAKFTKFRIGGNSSQETRSGKNKVDFINYVETIFDSSKVEKLSDGSYKFKHCDTTYTLFEGLLKAPCTLSWYARNDGTTTTGAPTFNFKIFYEDGTAETLSYTTSPDFSLKTKVLTKNVIKIVNSYIGTSPLTIIKDVQLEKGSKATEYEQYGTMPSEEFPSAIKNIDENIEIDICNKNLLSNKIEDYDISSGLYGYRKIVGELRKKYLVLTITDRDTSININEVYFGFTGNGKNGDEEKAWIVQKGSILGSLAGNKRYISTQNFKYFSFYPNNKETFNKVFNRFNIEVELSDESSPSNFITHESKNLVFPLTQGQKLMQGDYLADDGIHHKRKQVVLDGSDDEGWDYNGGSLSNNISAFTANISNLISVENTDTKVRVMCNKTIGLSASEATKLQKYNAIAVISDKRIYLCVQRSSFSTSPSTLKTWLQSNPITVEYELAEEVVEPYTVEQKEAYEQIKNAISYKGQTNIFSTNEIKPIFEVEALADIGLLLNNMQAQILAGGE